ncbi:MAG TPA: hypothetical protein VIH59_33080 [Candidatus Tectomicrobia bacterium]
MFSKFSKRLAAAVAVLLVGSTVALASEEIVSGTIQQMNTRAGTLTLKSEDGKLMELSAPGTLLNDLQTGDAVEVSTSGDYVTRVIMKGDPPAVQPGSPYQRPGTASALPRIR